MDSSRKSTSREDYGDTEADLNFLLYKTGRSVKNFFLYLGRGLTNIVESFLYLLVLLMRNFIWLILGAALGLGFGIFQISSNGSSYYSEMTVRTNFNSSRELYNTIDYLNALISTRQTDILVRFFNISPAEASEITQFSAQPVKSELIKAQMYRDEFLRFDRSKSIRQDTFWVRTINFKDFKESLTTYDYPFHLITVRSGNAAIFSKLQNGLIKHISSNPLLQDLRNKQSDAIDGEGVLLRSSIEKLDTLRKAYNERLIRGETTTTTGTNQLVLSDGKLESKIPELEVYDKMLELQDELKKNRRESAIEKEIIDIYSPFNPVGKKISFLQSVSEYALIGLCTAAVIVLLISLYKWFAIFGSSNYPKNTKMAGENQV